MLTSLKIENIAVIEKAEIFFDKGLNVLTGETGAGKSIIIDSINAVLGERTSKELIRTGADKGKVTAFFEDIGENVKEKLVEYGIDAEEDNSLLITRTISSDARSISKINGSNVTASMLKNIGRDLISICGQHDSQYLLSKEHHLMFIDDMAESGELLKDYLESYEKVRDITKRLRKIEKSVLDKEQRTDFLKYQIDELSNAGIKVGEKDRLLSEKKKILAKEKIDSALKNAELIIGGDDNAGGLSAGIYNLSECFAVLRDYDGKFQNLYFAIEDVKYLLDDCSAEISSSLHSRDGEYTDINSIEERLDILYRLSSKYGNTEEEMLSYLDRIREEYENIATSDELIEKLQDELEYYSEELFKKGCYLSDLRKLTALDFQKKVEAELRFLDMPDGQLVVNFEDAPATKTGMDEVEFLFSANRGQEPRPLSKIASGGELSRVMLAIRCVLSDSDTVSTMIFDEIDTGVSGRAAQKIAYKMHEISVFKQVLCVTHLAQIAVYADNHLLIEKNTDLLNTYTKVNALSETERVREVARIIGGDIITETTMNSAKELISFAKNRQLMQ